MKKDMLNELSGLDPETVNNIAENAPELGKDAQERILKKCIAKDMSCDEMTVSGTERYSRPRFRSFAAAAAVMVLIGGIGGAFALGKHMKKNAPVESKAGLLTTTEGTSDGKDRNNTETQPTAEAAPTEGTTAGEAGNLPETTYIEKPTQTDPLWLDPAYAEIDVAQPTTEYKVPDNVDDEQYEKWLNEVIPEQFRDAVRNLKPGEVIHLPCLPLRTTLDTNTIETTTATTTKTTTVTTIQQEKTTTQPKTTTEQPDNNEPDVYLTVL